MANTKISQLPSYTGSAADLRWFVMNNSGETETFKFSGFSTSITFGSGTDSIQSTNAIASGLNSIAIGNGAIADGQEGINIGNTPVPGGFRSINIGKNFGFGSGGIIIGNGSYSNGNGIAIGNETASYANCVVLGNGIDANRATGNFAITVGTNNPQNIGASSVILGSNNRLGNFIYDGQTYNNGGEFNFILSNNSRLGFTGSTNYTGNTIVGGDSNIIISEGSRNSIFGGGGGNVISGTTSGATLLGMNNYTPTRNDATFAMAYVMTNYAALDFANDGAAATGGVVLGQMYHHNGDMKIRIT